MIRKTVPRARGAQFRPMLALHTARQAPPLFMCGEFDYDGTSSRFEFVFKSVNDGAAQGTSTYTVVKGDTLQSIARAQLGDADLWFTIAQANGLADSADLEEGQVLRIPAVVVTSTNNDDGTFEAYDPTAVIGDTTPVIPQPPKKKQNPLKQIIIIVAAVVITVYTAGALSGATGGFLSTMQAGLGVMTGGAAGGAAGAAAFATANLSLLGIPGTLAVAGAAGSIGSQLVGMALGEQDKFSWRQVGLSALGSGISAGLPSFASSPVVNAMIKGAVSSTIAQGIGYASGLQESFSWRSVAASAITAGVAEAVGPTFGNSFGGQVATRFTSGLVAQGLTAKGGKINVGQIAADAFGSAIGNAIVGQITQAGQQEQRLQYTEDLRDATMGQLMGLGQNQPAGNGFTLGGSGGFGLKPSAQQVSSFGVGADGRIGSSINVPLTEAQEGALAAGFGPLNAERAQQISDAVGRLISPEDLQMNLQPPGAGGKRPTLGEVLGYAQTYPALANQIRELGDSVKWGMNPEDAVRALLNSPRATSTLKSDYETPLKTTASMSAWDGVDRPAQAQKNFNKSFSDAYFGPLVIAGTAPLSVSGGLVGGAARLGFAGFGGYELGYGSAAIANGEYKEGALRIGTGLLALEGIGFGPSAAYRGSLSLLNTTRDLYSTTRSALTASRDWNYGVMERAMLNGNGLERAAFAEMTVPTFGELNYMAKNTLDFSTQRNGALFWSGSRENMKTAQMFGTLTGNTTLEQTIGGRYLDSLNLFSINGNQAAAVFNTASARFAAGSSGEVNAFTFGAQRFGPYGERTWWSIEQPILRNLNPQYPNSNVTRIQEWRFPWEPKQ